MDSQFIPSKTSKTLTYLSWLIITLAIFSCSARADYNLIIGFSILFLRSNYATDRFKYFIKATKYWKHGEETSDLWKSLSFVHNTTYILGIIEHLLKYPIVLFLYRQFKGQGGDNKELLSFNYSPK